MKRQYSRAMISKKGEEIHTAGLFRKRKSVTHYLHLRYDGDFDAGTVDSVRHAFLSAAQAEGLRFAHESSFRGRSSYHIAGGGMLFFSWTCLSDIYGISFFVRIDAALPEEAIETIFSESVSAVNHMGIKLGLI